MSYQPEPQSSPSDQIGEQVGQMSDKVGEAVQQANDKAQDLIAEQADQRSTQAGQWMQQTGQSLHEAGQTFRQKGETTTASMVEAAARRIEDYGVRLQSMDAAQIRNEIATFARDNVWAVAAGALLAGIVASRLLRTSVEAISEERDGQSGQQVGRPSLVPPLHETGQVPPDRSYRPAPPSPYGSPRVVREQEELGTPGLDDEDVRQSGGGL